MQKKHWILWPLLLVFAFAAMTGGCGGGGNGSNTPTPGLALTVMAGALNLAVGGAAGTITAHNANAAAM